MHGLDDHAVIGPEQNACRHRYVAVTPFDFAKIPFHRHDIGGGGEIVGRTQPEPAPAGDHVVRGNRLRRENEPQRRPRVTKAKWHRHRMGQDAAQQRPWNIEQVKPLTYPRFEMRQR